MAPDFVWPLFQELTSDLKFRLYETCWANDFFGIIRGVIRQESPKNNNWTGDINFDKYNTLLQGY